MENTTQQSPRILVDSRGIWCPPTPLTDLFKAWRQGNIGDEIELLATEPNTEADVRAWAKKSGNRIIEVEQKKDYVRVVVKVTRKGKSMLKLAASRRSFSEPDETKETPKGRLQLVTIGGFTLGLRSLQPGWKWSTSMKPIAKTETCEIRHMGYVLSGQMAFSMDDGTVLEVGAGDVFDVQAGHDAWTVGKDPFVFVDLIGAVNAQGRV
ncbi:MAG: sulfurtransferase TusA family protein [Nitrososphaerales archaeon]|nr:sulfurtransferase TusA family protein [Nitrososphaerales archaeon]